MNMKHKYIFLLLIFQPFLNSLVAKDAINYQAVIRQNDGKIAANQKLDVEITIVNSLDSSSNILYQEVHHLQTNDLGVINLKIGLGETVVGDFDMINWGNGPLYVRVGVDLNSRNNFVTIGVSQILYVPYALYSKKSKELDIANMSDTFIADLASKLNPQYQPSVLDTKVTNQNYAPIAETKDIVVYQLKNGNAIEAVFNNIAIVKTSKTQFKIGENGVNGDFNIIVNLNVQNFPNLISGSVISKIIILPWNRNATAPVPALGWRCCVITDKGQIYHNFPNRTPQTNKPDGAQLEGDINKWDESVVWDLPNRRLPSKILDVFPYNLNPCLPDSAYQLFPSINSDNGYGHGGFNTYCTKTVGDRQVNLPRFYFHKRSDGNNPFFFMGGFETSMKIQLIGTYRSNTSSETAARICLFASSDGGRQWFNIYEFAQNSPNAFGNALIGNNIQNTYQPNSLSFQKRDFIFPSSLDKNPANLFKYGDVIPINDIIKTSNSLVLKTSNPHNLKTGDLIVISKNDTATVKGYDFLCNTNINTKNGGNGKIWKVEVLTNNTFKLYEYLNNPDSNLPVRHIHAINRIKDGFIISSGEIYPQSWILYLQIKYSDTYSIVNPWDNFNIIRLTSTENSVQRTLGTIMFDDEEQTIMFASDEATVPNKVYTIEGRTDLSISRSSTGIYKGKLSDIDDFSKFTCIYEAKQVAYHFKEINDMLIFAGQQGELAISVDKGQTWRKFSVFGSNTFNLAAQYPKGVDDKGRYILDQLIIYRK